MTSYLIFLMGTRLKIKKKAASLRGGKNDFELRYLKNQLAHEGQWWLVLLDFSCFFICSQLVLNPKFPFKLLTFPRSFGKQCFAVVDAQFNKSVPSDHSLNFADSARARWKAGFSPNLMIELISQQSSDRPRPNTDVVQGVRMLPFYLQAAERRLWMQLINNS